MAVVVKRAGGARGRTGRRRRIIGGGRLATFLTYDPETRRAVVKVYGGDVIRVPLARVTRAT